MWDREYHFGKHFQRLVDVKHCGREGHSFFRTLFRAYEMDGFKVFPGLTDVAFQLVATAFFDNVSRPLTFRLRSPASTAFKCRTQSAGCECTRRNAPARKTAKCSTTT